MLNRRLMLAGAIGALNLQTVIATAFAAEQAASGRPEIDVYARSPQIEDVGLSPDGGHIALLTKDGKDYVLIVHAITSGKNQYFKLGQGKMRGLFWGGNANVILQASTTDSLQEFVGDKQEHFLAYNVDIRTSDIRTLFSKMSGYYNTVQGDLRRIRVDGKYHVTASNYNMAENSYPLNLFQFDVETGRHKLLDNGFNDTHEWVLTPAGAPVARSRYIREQKLWHLEFKLKEGWKVVYQQREAIDYPSLVGLGRNEQTVIVYVDAGDKGGFYYEVDAAGIFSEPLNTQLNSTPLFHPATGLFCGFAILDDWVVYAYSEPKMQRLADLAIAAMPDYKTRIVGFAAEDPRKMLLYGEAVDDPGAYYFIDFSTGHNTAVGQNYPGLTPAWVTQKKPINYKAADGLTLHGYVTLPPAAALNGREAKNLPLVVLPHGGPNARDTGAFDWQAQLYASRGYAVLQPNFRGSTGYGQAFVEAGYGQWGRKMQTDLSDGVRYLTQQGLIDPKRVCIVGASYGGYAALAGVTLDPGVYNCAVSVAGISDIKSMLLFDSHQTGSRVSPVVLYLKRSVGDEKTLDQVSPIRHIDKVNVPVLLIHGRDDIVVNIGQSRRMEKALKDAGKDVTLIELAGEDHWQSVDSTRLEMAKAIIAFIEKHNPPG